MANFQHIASVDDVAPGEGAVVEVDGKAIALFNVAGEFYAIENSCTHSGGPLGEGRLEETAVTCPWHGAKFDVGSGRVLAPPAPADVDPFQTKVEDGEVWIEVP